MEVEGFDLPDDLYYYHEHIWARVEGDLVTCGLTDFAQNLAGDVAFVNLPYEEDDVEQGKKAGTVETGKWLGTIYAPVSGEVTEVNEELEDEPSLVNEDPYGAGWFFVIKMKDSSELESLLKGEKAVEWLKNEIQEHREDIKS